MVLISFLGTGNYQKATYTWPEVGAATTAYAPAALSALLRPSRVVVIGTDEAFNRHGEALRREIAFEEARIATRFDEAGAWEIFDTIARYVAEGEHVVLDITHGFRSQPVVALAAAQFLEMARRAEVRHLVYGVFRPEAGPEGEAPLVDLREFLSLSRWTVAARQFVRDGRADALADLLGEIHERSYQMPGATRLRSVGPAGEALRSLTQALAVVRPHEAAKWAKKATRKLEASQAELSGTPALSPLGVLLKEVIETIAPMQTEDIFSPQGLKAQAAMMRFCLRTGQLQQAVTLAREALVTHEARARGLDPKPVPRSARPSPTPAPESTETDPRHETERALGALVKRQEQREDLGDDADLAVLWDRLTKARNDINHAGMNPSPNPGDKLVRNVESVVERTARRVAGEPEPGGTADGETAGAEPAA